MNRKLKAIASLVDIKDSVIDIGCDHAYLSIYLKKNKLCKNVYASDISDNVLEVAKKNILKENVDIPLFLSDGFRDVPNMDINTAIISGMGTTTILDIVDYKPEDVCKFIISSNNDYYLLRKQMQKNNYFLKKEIVICEKEKYYPIMVFIKDKKKRNHLELKYGISKDTTYFKYLMQKEKEILLCIPKKHKLERLKHYKNILELKILIKRN